MNWNLKTYDELTKDELYDILKLRCQVFVEEQKCTGKCLPSEFRGRPIYRSSMKI